MLNFPFIDDVNFPIHKGRHWGKKMITEKLKALETEEII